MAPIEEQAIIMRARAGDGTAFEKLYKANLARVYAVVASRTQNRDDIDDLVQVAFIRAYEGLQRFRGDAAFSTWVTRIAMNVCVSHYESQCVRQKWASWLHSPEGLSRIGPRWTQDPEAHRHTRECQEKVRTGICNLPPHYQEAMRLRYIEDYSYAEIEKEMNVSMGTVKTWLYRGREMLQETFKNQDINM